MQQEKKNDKPNEKYPEKMINTMDDLDKLQEASWAPKVDVYININFTKLLDIDTINQRFQAEAIIESRWVDPSIVSFKDTLDEKKMWKPDLYIENGIKDVREEVSYQIVPIGDDLQINKVDDSGKKLFMICEMRKVTGIFYENLELQDFPLDVQDLTIFVVTKKPGKIINFISLCGGKKDGEKEKINTNSMLDKSMWELHMSKLTNNDFIKRDFSYGQRVYPGIKGSIKVFRQPGFFFWNAVLPFMLVTFASLAPFVNDIKNPASRLPATCTLILTSVGTRFTIGRLLPTVSYLTSLDKYSLGTMFIITIELLYHAIMGAIFPHMSKIGINEKTAYIIDFGAFCVFFFIMILKQLLFGIFVLRVNHFRKEVKAGKHDILNEKIETHQNKFFLKIRKKNNDMCEQSEQMLKDELIVRV